MAPIKPPMYEKTADIFCTVLLYIIDWGALAITAVIQPRLGEKEYGLPGDRVEIKEPLSTLLSQKGQ